MMRFPIDPRQFSEMQRYIGEHQKYSSLVPEDARRMYPLIQEALKNRPSQQQFAAMREQARWASEAARGIDPATLRTLQQAASASAAVADNARLLRGVLGPDGLAAANLLTNRRVGLRLRASSEEAEQGEGSVKEISPEDIRRAEELAAGPEVRELLEKVDAEGLVDEAEAVLKSEGLPDIGAEEVGEVELYGVHFEPSNLLVAAVVLFAALQGGSDVAPELASAIREALDVIADLLAVLIAAREFGVADGVSEAPDRTDRKSDNPAVRLIDELLEEDPRYDEETWPEIAAAIDRDRPSNRKLFAE